MRFLVTGGAGFIGSHITERLLNDGHFVRVLDNFSSGKESNLSFAFTGDLVTWCPGDFELIRGDIRDYDVCLDACNGVDYVLHQAALRSVPKSLELPHEYNAVNIDGTLNILQAALKSKVKRVVIASTSAIYGDTQKFPQSETDAPLLISPYALTKLAGEYYSRVYSENYGLETVNLRYFNVFGPRQSLDDEYAVVIPKFIDCILNDKQPPIHGTGKQSRDFTYVDNVVQANILAATTRVHSPQSTVHSEASTFCEVFNVACSSDNSILELVVLLNKITGKSIAPIHTPTRAGDVFRTLADISKITAKLGYKPAVNFEEGLRRTVEYFRSLLNTQYSIHNTKI
ncbi:MAG: SDR family oxidoreductase [Candidatus Omnitrophota bacterium]